jgi:dephospho-CoA kinase
MLKVGITGLMGSGKSYISSQFSELGVPVYNSDERAKWVNNNIPELKEQLIAEFGDVYTNGLLDKYKVRKIVFVEGGEEKLKRLNQICHPYVRKDFEDFCTLHKDKPFILAESAILFESGMSEKMDRIIFVDVWYSVRLERAMKRDNITREEYDTRMKSQQDDSEKKRRSDFIIDNSTPGLKLEEIKKIFNILVNLKKDRIFV